MFLVCCFLRSCFFKISSALFIHFFLINYYVIINDHNSTVSTRLIFDFFTFRFSFTSFLSFCGFFCRFFGFCQYWRFGGLAFGFFIIFCVFVCFADVFGQIANDGASLTINSFAPCSASSSAPSISILI